MRLISIFLVVIFSVGVFAEEKKISSVVNLYGVIFQYGIPPWVGKTDNPLAEFKPYRSQKGNDFILEFIPADETFEDWNTMFAVSATRNNRTVPVNIWKDYVLSTLKSACMGYKENTLVMKGHVALAQITCPRVKGAPMKGYEGGKGEIAVFAFLIHDNVLINHYIEWRGKAFDADDQTTWPVTQEEIEKAIETLKSAKAFNDKFVVRFDTN